MSRRDHPYNPPRTHVVVIPRESAHPNANPRQRTLRDEGADDRTICPSIALFLIFAAALIAPSAAFPADKDKPVVWKPITQALLRVDDQAVKNWNVYEENKKGDPLLLEIGNRYLLIRVRERKVFELAPDKIERKGGELLWGPTSLPSEPLGSTDWLIKDVGFAYRISVRLLPENRIFDLQLPHPMDLRYL